MCFVAEVGWYRELTRPYSKGRVFLFFQIKNRFLNMNLNNERQLFSESIGGKKDETTSG
jgi:hypothetical protein